MPTEGALDVETLAAELADPGVVAVYTQTLSYTDGISDDLPAILAVSPQERAQAHKQKAKSKKQKLAREAGGSAKANSKRA